MRAAAGIVIVGAGECGARAAFALREEGYAGRVTLIGGERHLPYERPPLSKEGMAAEPAGMKTIASAEKLSEAGVELIFPAEAVSIDRAEKILHLADGLQVGYDKLLLATGARPRRLPMAENIRHCAYLRTHDDAQVIGARLLPHARVAIIGGGFIGLELAAAARARGCAVTVIEAQERILMRGVPAEIADRVANTHAAHGTVIRCGTAITGFEEAGDRVIIRLGDEEPVEADFCIIGIGAVPNAELAEQAGLTVDDGISVDASMFTSDPHILAAGDCCSFPLAIYGGRRARLEAWRNAQEQGTLAARNVLGKGEQHAAVPWFWSDQFELSLQIAGLISEGRGVVRRDLDDGAFILFHLDADGRLVAASGIGPGNAVARDIRLAEMLIASGAHPPCEKLAAPDIKLKALLAA